MDHEFVRQVRARRSIRSYTEQKIPRDTLITLAEAGLSAPSARNGRPWELVIIENEETLRKLSTMRPYWKMLDGAAAAIIVAGQDGRYFQQDCAACTQNILLSAQAMGLGGVWLGLYPNMDVVEEVAKLAELPAEILPLCVISLGYPAGEIPQPRPADHSKIHFERFNKEKK